MEKISVALLGLGTMGKGMAANLLKAGFPLAVYNRTASTAEPFATSTPVPHAIRLALGSVGLGTLREALTKVKRVIDDQTY